MTQHIDKTAPIFDVPGVGRIAILMEPGGGSIGWITAIPATT